MTSRAPAIGQAYRDLHAGIAAKLRPYVQAHLVDEIATQIVADLVAAPGWRPPLRVDPDVIVDARRANTTRNLNAETPPAPSAATAPKHGPEDTHSPEPGKAGVTGP